MEQIGEEYRNKSGIYKIINCVDNKFYIGSSVNLYRRCKDHIKLLENNKHSNSYLQNAYNLHRKENFKFCIIEFVDDHYKLLEREQYWFDFTQCCHSDIGYNLSPTAGNTLGLKHSKQARINNSLAKRGKMSDISIEEASRVKVMLNCGKTVREIAEELCILNETVSSIRKGKTFHYVEPKLRKESLNPKAKLNPETDVVEIKNLLNLGFKVKSLAEMYGIDYRTISRIKNNEIWRKLGEKVNAPVRRKRMTTEKVREVKDLISKGSSNKEIAEKLDLLRSSVSDIRRGHTWKD